MTDETRRFLLLIELPRVTVQRLQDLVPRLQKAIDRMSGADFALAYRAPNGKVISYVMRSKLAAAQIRARLTEEPQAWRSFQDDPEYKVQVQLQQSRQDFAVVELGTDFDTRRFLDKLEPWLAHH